MASVSTKTNVQGGSMGGLPEIRRFRPVRSTVSSTLWSTLVAAAVTGLWSLPAAAQDPAMGAGANAPLLPDEGMDSRLTLGMDPSEPNVGALPGGVTPAFGQKPTGAGDWRFDYHGMFTMPIVVGLNQREEPGPGESATVLHTPPVVPDDYEVFSHTGVVPTPYAQLNFSIGNSIVTGNVHLLARQATISTTFFDPASQAGINDVYLTVHPDLAPNVDLRMHIGAFSRRYGAMGQYDEGLYGTTLIGRVNGVGENIIAGLALSDDFTVMVEQGIMGSSNKTPNDLTPDYWNDFADTNVGTTFVNHWHAGVNYKRMATLGLHYLNAFSQDDRAANPIAGDGALNTIAGDLRLTLGRFGHFYFALSHVEAINARVVGSTMEVLNTRGGPSLVQNYLGDQSEGDGGLTIMGAQYDLSIGRLVSYPTPFYGDGPDIVVSLFGMGVSVESRDERYDGRWMQKFGAEATYSLLSWLAASVRFDRVDPDDEELQRSFAVWSPRVIFRTDWQATDQIVLQYSKWINGSEVTVRDGAPPREDPSIVPDTDVLSLSASMWW